VLRPPVALSAARLAQPATGRGHRRLDFGSTLRRLVYPCRLPRRRHPRCGLASSRAVTVGALAAGALARGSRTTPAQASVSEKRVA
jgi:hypothetical protein